VIKVWNAAKGKEALVLDGDAKKIASVVFSPNCKRPAAGGADQVVRLWDVGSFKQHLARPWT
jgi:WD40 repeat protein